MRNGIMSKLGFAALLVALLSCCGASQALAAPILGGQLYSLGGDVVVEVLPASAGYTSQLWLFSPDPDTYIATNNNVGYTVNLGSFSAGTELVFGIYVTNTGYTYSMGPGSRNPDGLMHATVDFIAPGVANVGFEDLYGGGDMDYNDNMFQFRGSIAPDPGTTTPEPATLALFGIGSAAAAFLRRKNRKK